MKWNLLKRTSKRFCVYGKWMLSTACISFKSYYCYIFHSESKLYFHMQWNKRMNKSYREKKNKLFSRWVEPTAPKALVWRVRTTLCSRSGFSWERLYLLQRTFHSWVTSFWILVSRVPHVYIIAIWYFWLPSKHNWHILHYLQSRFCSWKRESSSITTQW